MNSSTPEDLKQQGRYLMIEVAVHRSTIVMIMAIFWKAFHSIQVLLRSS